MTEAYALFKDGGQISKAHSTFAAAFIEAHEIGAIASSGVSDFPGDRAPSCETVSLLSGYSIEVVK